VGERAAILSHVSVVFHVAATVRFNEKLKTALQTNLAGTQSVLQLCRDMQQLKVSPHWCSNMLECIAAL
jgi:fatty acyl-CoA reductase